MATYKKINNQAVQVSGGNDVPEYFFDTLAEAQAALANIEDGANIYVKEASTSDLGNRVEDIETLTGNTDISTVGDGTITGAIDTINSNLSERCKFANLFSNVDSADTPNGITTYTTLHDGLLEIAFHKASSGTVGRCRVLLPNNIYIGGSCPSKDYNEYHHIYVKTGTTITIDKTDAVVTHIKVFY